MPQKKTGLGFHSFFELTRHLKQRKQAFTYLNKT